MAYLRLRFADEDEARQHLAAFVGPDGAWTGADTLVVLGTLYERPTVNPDDTVTPGAAKPGYHADLITEDPALIAALEPYNVSPVASPDHTILGA